MTTPQGELEHANLWVQDIDATVRFLSTALPHLQVRGGREFDGGRWVHLGTETSYVCLNEGPANPGSRGRMNHLGYSVRDLDDVRSRLEKAGYQEGSSGEEHTHRRRMYFLDGEGLEWEFVEYLSEAAAERNQYA
jgi:catechol 2,3-dioxygenase-like lactoylglutathione lyase family enzyme